MNDGIPGDDIGRPHLKVVSLEPKGTSVWEVLRAIADELQAEHAPGSTYKVVVLVPVRLPDGYARLKLLDSGIDNSFEYIGILYAGMDEVCERARCGPVA